MCPPWQDLLAQPAVKLNRELNCLLTFLIISSGPGSSGGSGAGYGGGAAGELEHYLTHLPKPDGPRH